jgi:glucose-1-phosphate thymidylyltransferase
MISCGIKEFCIISSPEYLPMYERMFGNGNHLGLDIVYKVQYKPNGIAESFIIAEDFIGNDNVSLILGDNIFHGVPRIKMDFKGALVFAYEVTNPWDYAVVQFDDDNIKQIVEKPKEFISSYAIPGLYFFDNKVIGYSKSLKPSKRNELEITDVMNIYLNNNSIDVIKFPRGTAWLDAGQPDTLFQSAAYVKTIQERQGIRIGCIEEECYNKGFIDKNQLKKVVDKLPKSEYKSYLQKYE